MVARLRDLAASSLPRAVPRGHVRDLMRHHAGQFRFAVRLQNQPGVDEEESAGQRERIHFFAVDHLDGERHLGVRIPHQVLAHAIYVLRDHRVVDDLGLPLHLLRQPFADRDLFLDRVEIHALSDVAISDLFGVFLGVCGEGGVRGNQNEGHHQAKASGKEAFHCRHSQNQYKPTTEKRIEGTGRLIRNSSKIFVPLRSRF